MTTLSLATSKAAPGRYAMHIAMIVMVLASAACERRSELVHSYDVPKEAPPPSGEMPVGDLAWDLPAGWRNSPNPNDMRFATILAGEGDDLVEVAVTRLGGMAGGIGANINRWRNQVGLPPATEDELKSLVIPIHGRGAVGVMVDLLGPVSPTGEPAQAPRMLAAIVPGGGELWFIKTLGTQAVIETQRGAFDELCRSMHFTGGNSMAAAPTPRPTAPPAGGTPADGPRWDTLPDGWSSDPQPTAMSIASMTVSGDGQEASLTITPLGGSQDLLANINRWRRQLGLGPVADLREAAAATIEIDGVPGNLVDIAGEQGRTLGAITSRGQTTWFFKLSGPEPLVSSHRESFEEFIRSIRFDRSPS